jgi:hypothetical protein
MKTNELRIGNFVTDGIFQIEIFTISEDDVWGVVGNIINLVRASNEDFYKRGDYHFNVENIEGIPLTEEWLLKLGFEQRPEGEPLYYKDRIMVNMGNHNIVHILGTNNGHVLPRQFGGYKVHQLQNLYFALTTEELILKP